MSNDRVTCYQGTVTITRATQYTIVWDERHMLAGEKPEDFLAAWNPDDGDLYVTAQHQETRDWDDGPIQSFPDREPIPIGPERRAF